MHPEPPLGGAPVGHLPSRRGQLQGSSADTTRTRCLSAAVGPQDRKSRPGRLCWGRSRCDGQGEVGLSQDVPRLVSVSVPWAPGLPCLALGRARPAVGLWTSSQEQKRGHIVTLRGGQQAPSTTRAVCGCDFQFFSHIDITRMTLCPNMLICSSLK